MKKEYKWGDKQFLNKLGHNSIASIGYEFDIEHNDGGTYVAMNGTISISDCYRVVSLDLGVWDEDDYKNGLHKIHVLQTIAKKMEKDYIEANKCYIKAKAKAKAKKKKDSN